MSATTAGVAALPAAGLAVLATALAVAGLVVLAITVGTARRPGEPIPDLTEYLRRWSVLHGGYDPSQARVTGGWLRLVYHLAAAPARRGVRPNALTVAGVWTGAAALLPAAAGGRWLLAAAGVVAVSGLLDSLDGAVASLTGRVTRFGYVLDSVADRVVDGVYLVVLYLAGAAGPVCVLAGAATVLLEYTRARAGAAGFAEVGIVTPGERPTRIVVTALGLLATAVAPGLPVAVTVAAAVIAGLTTLSWLLLIRVVHRGLTGAAPPG